MIRPRRVRALTETDLASWAAYARHVQLLPGRSLTDAPPEMPQAPSPPAQAQPFERAMAAAPRAMPSALVIGIQPPGVDNANWERFRTGRLPVARKLDLHGSSAQRAFHALTSFIQRAHADRVRVVEIVTGRGSSEGSGVIRREFPMWLNLPDLRPLVLGAAHPHAANTGAVRLLLRKPR